MPLDIWVQPQPNNLIDTWTKAEAIKQARTENALNDLKISEAQDKALVKNRLRDAFARGVDYSTDEGFQKLAGIDPDTAIKLRKGLLDTRLTEANIGKTTAQGEKAKADTEATQSKSALQDAEFILRDPTNEPAVLGVLGHWAQSFPQLNEVIGKLNAQRGTPAFAQTAGALSMSVKDQATQRLDAARLGETQRHNLATESTAQMNAGKPQFISTDAGTFAVSPRNPAAGAVPVPGIPAKGPAAAVHEADKKWLEEQDKTGATAEKLSSTIEQARSIIQKPGGVLGSGPLDRVAYGFHQLGVNNSNAAVNTERLREIGAQMTLSFGSLGAQVSNADREVYERAQGNFERAKSLEAMQLSLDEMASVAQRTIEKINHNRTLYQQTGQKPDFTTAAPSTPAAPRRPTQPRPSQLSPKVVPGADPGVSLEQVQAEMRRRGLMR